MKTEICGLILVLFFTLTSCDDTNVDDARRKADYVAAIEKYSQHSAVNKMPKKVVEKLIDTYVSDDAIDHFKPLISEDVVEKLGATIKVPRGGQECFYTDCPMFGFIHFTFETENPPSMMSSGKIKARIQLPNGSSYWIHGKKANVIKELGESENRVSGNYKMECEEYGRGVYEICLDNRGDRTTSKLVLFTINSISRTQTIEYHLNKAEKDDEGKPAYEGDLLYETYNYVFKLVVDVRQSRLAINHVLAKTGRDWKLLNDNLSRVNTFSIVYIVIIVVTSYVQVRVLKRWFNIDTPVINGKISQRT